MSHRLTVTKIEGNEVVTIGTFHANSDTDLIEKFDEYPDCMGAFWRKEGKRKEKCYRLIA